VGTGCPVRSSNAVVKVTTGLVVIIAVSVLTCCGGASTGTKGAVPFGTSTASLLAPPAVAVSSSGSCVAEPNEAKLSQLTPGRSVLVAPRSCHRGLGLQALRLPRGRAEAPACLGGGLDGCAVGALDVPLAVGVAPGSVAVFFEPVMFLA
jgi:hypothetical protein